MSVFFVRASTATLLFCAACGGGSDPTTTSSTSGSGGSSTSSTTSASSTTGSGGSMATMDCDLAITDATGANVDIAEFASMPGQGAEKHPQDGPFEYGFAATDNSMTVLRLLNIGVSGPALTQGMTYSLDDKGSVLLLTINDIAAGGEGERNWSAAPGGKMTVDAITPGVISSYRNVTFGLTDVGMMVNPASGGANKATGTFKLSGKCTGAITNYQP